MIPMRPIALLIALLCALAAAPALAQSDATSDPREFNEAARKAYAQSLKEARAFIAERRYPEAIAILDKLAADRPREPQARFLKGVALADTGKSAEAIVVFQAILGDYPELPEPHNNLAVLYAQKGEYELARGELEAAISAAPDYAVAYENLGDVYARLAALNYEKALARDARNKTASVKLKLARDVLAPAASARRCGGAHRAGRPRRPPYPFRQHPSRHPPVRAGGAGAPAATN